MKVNTLSGKSIAMLLNFLMTLLFIWFALTPLPGANNLLKRLEYIAYDMRLNLLIPPKIYLKNSIAIVDVDEKSLKEAGRWPWSREKLSALVQALYQEGVTVIAFDMLFPETEDNQDRTFSKILHQEKNKNILGIFFSNVKTLSIGKLPLPAVVLNPHEKWHIPAMQSYIANIAALQQAAGQGGAISTIPEQDGVIRRYALLQRYENNLYPALATEAVRLYLLETKIKLHTEKINDYQAITAVNLGNGPIATDEQGRIFIPYLGPSHTFPYYSAIDILKHRLPPHQLQNALVFVGTSSVGLSDLRSTPVESVYPGVEVHANVAEALLTGHFPYTPDWVLGAQVALLVLLGIILSVSFVFLGPVWIMFTSILTILGVFLGSLELWKVTEIVFPVVASLLLVVVLAAFNMTYGFFTESRRRNELKKVFGQYVPAGRVEEIIRHPEAANVFEGERKVMSVLFMDIRNFTAISEKLTLAELRKLLNFFLTKMTEVIFKHGGTIDKYVGDMVMAFWGAPLPDEKHAEHALSAGWDLSNQLALLQPALKEMNLPVVQVGIGINTGMMSVGDMGSSYRRAYTVLGDAVNLASRLESLCKYYGVEIICGEKTIQGQEEFVFRLLDKVRVKGKQIGIAIYEPQGLRVDLGAQKQAELAQYENALQAYFQRDWLTAQKLFLSLQQNYPHTVLYQLYLNRVTQFIRQPPPSEWDGVWEHLEK